MSIGNLKASLFSCCLFFGLFQSRCFAVSSISPSRPLSQGQMLSSPSDVFELGFFTPNNSKNQYVGIWYKGSSPRTVVWVANRETPITESNVSLLLGAEGRLRIQDAERKVLWSSNTSLTSSTNTSVAELSDGGNFVVRDGERGNVLWQSFDDPCDTFVPGMTLVSDQRTGRKSVLNSWRNEADPSPGEYAAEIIPQVPPEVFVLKNLKPYWRSGPWSRQQFLGIEGMDSSYVEDFTLDQNFDEGTVTLSYSSYSNSTLLHLRLSPEGSLRVMIKTEKDWFVNWEEPKHPCDFYGVCGPFGLCLKHKKPMCKCLQGFVPKSDQEWSNRNWTSGCVRKRELNCQKAKTPESEGSGKVDTFVLVEKVKLPYHYECNFSSDDPNDCHKTCLGNCSCLAYAAVQGIGCLLWTRELVDMVEFTIGQETLFLRIADTGSGAVKLIASLTTLSFVMILGAVTFGYMRWKARRHDTSDTTKMLEEVQRSDLKEQDASDLHLFEFQAILTATNNFCMENKLGQGGFGPVYKGKLKDGRDIAVKRLSSSSGQGVEEFKTEAMLISKLQHRNLVRLLGCCIEKEEKLLVYEFMVNKSLDTLLFDPGRKSELDWPTRFNIIQGIARGLLYLHHDSSVRVIHRDLKVSNILLDEQMNPKISDFGLARIVQGTQSSANTHRVVGTLGYMSPEYAFSGIFSEKSDVFSFGVLVLEIIAGRRLNSFTYEDQQQSLIAYAWRSWCEGLSIVDKALVGSLSSVEVTRCVHIALLCVQERPLDRPAMTYVVLALNSDVELPRPKQPAFAFQDIPARDDLSHFNSVLSLNDLTQTMLMGR